MQRRSIGVVLALGLAASACAAAPLEVSLPQSVNAAIDEVPTGLSVVETRSLVLNGKRKEVDEAVLLIRDPHASMIRKERVWVGDQVVIGKGIWEVVALEHGSTRGPATIRLRRVGDRSSSQGQ